MLEGTGGQDVAAGQDASAGRRVATAVRLAGGLSALVWVVVALAWREGPFALTFDDAFYYLEIARRIVAGDGSTFDGINTTNGYHPLWMAVSTVPFLLGLAGTAALRFVLVVQAVLWGATWWWIGSILGRAVDGWPVLTAQGRARAGRVLAPVVGVVALLVAANPTVARIAVSGLESGLVFLVGAVILDAALRGSGRLLAGRSARWRWSFGALLGLAVLSRTDHVLLVATIAVALAFEPREGRSWGEQVRLALPVLGIPAVVTAIYLASNVALVGSPMQISGSVKRADVTGVVVAVAAVAAVLGLLGLRAAAAHRPGRRLVRAKRFVDVTAWYGVFCLGIVVYYTQLQVQVWLWYFAPLLLWGVVLFLLFLLDVGEQGIAEAPAGRSPVRALAPLLAVLAVPLLVGLVLQWRTFTDPHIRSIQLANQRAGRWVGHGLPKDAVLASWDAGALGYYADRPVVNLDGVVNSPDWYEATQDSPEAVRRFLDREHVRYIVNHGTPVDGDDPDIVDFVRLVYGDERADGLELVETFPFTYSGNTVGSGGRSSGSQQLAVFVYRLPPP